MSITRRNFIKIGSVSAALAAGTCLGMDSRVFGQAKNARTAELPSGVYGDTLFSYHAETFSKYIGTSFYLFAEGFAVSAVLTEIKHNVPSAKIKKLRGRGIESTEDFMLSFRVSDADAQQANYTVIHPELGQFDLLMTSARNNKGEFLLNAVINRL